jgi:hypothetical protein
MFDRVAVDTTSWSDDNLELWLSLPPDQCEEALVEESYDPDREGDGWSDPHLLELIAREERCQAVSLGHQMRAMAAHIEGVMAAAPPWHQQDAYKSASAEIALRLGLGASGQDRRIGEAHAVATRLPATLDALCAGKLTYRKMLVILDETANIGNRAVLRQVEAEVLAVAEGFNPPRLREQLRRIIERRDKEALKQRVAEAPKQRSVSLHRERDGMATINAFLPIDKALAAFGVVDTLARACQGPNEDRTIDQLRADVFHDLICHPGDQPSRISYEVQVVATADLLLDRDGAEPARMADGSPIPDDLARAIATDARWRLLLTDPLTRHLLDVGADTYQPRDKVARFIRLRDRRCRWPGCGQPSRRCDIDHQIKFRIGGRTVVINLATLCERHHQVKDLPGWSAIQDPVTAAITFTTPHGDRYTTRPPTVDGDIPAVEVRLARDEPEVPPF